MINRERSTGVLLLRQLRERRGWSWSDLARALSDTARRLGVMSLTYVHVASIKRTVARWESASDDTVPGEGGGLTALLAHYVHTGVEEVLREPTRLDAEFLHGLNHAVTDIDQQVGTVPFVRLQLLLAPVVRACHRLTAIAIPAPLRNTLYLAATNTYLLAGRLAFETRDDGASAALYAAAIDADASGVVPRPGGDPRPAWLADRCGRAAVPGPAALSGRATRAPRGAVAA